MGESKSQDLEKRAPGDTDLMISFQANLNPFEANLAFSSKDYFFENIKGIIHLKVPGVRMLDHFCLI